MDVIKYNFHHIERGRMSDKHVFADPTLESTKTEVVEVEDCAPGLWYLASMLNNSCVPNANWMSMGDLIVVKAISDIVAGQEITLCYTVTFHPHEARQHEFKDVGFKCLCPLCVADEGLKESERLTRCQILDVVRQMRECVRPGSNYLRDETIAACVRFVKKCLKTYSAAAYKELPLRQTARLFYYLGHVYLGRLPDWTRARKDDISKAAECFKACVQLGLGIKLAEDILSGYCELIIVQYSSTDYIGILALVGLAELAYISGTKRDKQRAVSLLACAKTLYWMRFSEDATFDDHYSQYRCKVGLKDIKAPAPPHNWEQTKTAALASPSPIPGFLK